MHIREPRDFEGVRSQRRTRGRVKKLRHLLFLALLVVIGLSLITYGAYLRPLPALAAKTITPSTSTEQVALTWPASGQASIGAVGQGVLASTANQKPVPIASVAKVMTALAVLKKRPLAAGQPGPTITMTTADVTRYSNYVAQGGSVVRVENGEQLTEYQALQAILLPSANNISDSLAIWAYGSMEQYHTAANQLANSLGMAQSTFAGDASGLLPESTSTSHDLVLLGQAALAEPVLKEIVNQKTATLPIVGTVSNVNVLLGKDGIIGIKTGNTEQAGGCYLFAAERTVAGGKAITAVGAITAAPSLGQAMASSLPLLDSFYQGFSSVVVVPKGKVVVRYDVPWSTTPATAVAAQDVSVLSWRGSKATVKVQANTIKAPQVTGAQVGTVTAQSSYGQTTISVVLANSIEEPQAFWRITRH